MQEDQTAAMAQRHGVRLMLQFGSSVVGPTHQQSDLDIAVLLERVPDTFDAHADLQADVQQLFPGCDLDLSIINRADPLFLKKILETCRVLYGAVRELHLLRMYAFKRYQDHRRFLAMERAYVSRALRTFAR